MTDWRPKLEREGIPLYQALADALVADVASGKLAPGSRLPTHRELADALGASVGTVTRAYQDAEARGALDATPGRGTFVRRLRGEPSMVDGALSRDPAVVDLSIAHPLYAMDPDLASALRAVAERVDVQRLLRYQTLSDHPLYRDAGNQWLEQCGTAPDRGAMVITAGAQHACFVLLSALTRPGNLVAVDELTYTGFLSAAEQGGRRVRGVPMDEHGMIPEALVELCREECPKAVYLVPTVQNPKGIVVPQTRREELARVAEEHDLLIIEDDTLRMLVPDPPPLLASLAPHRTFFVGSLSKTVCGGLRLAFVRCPPRFLDGLNAAVGATVFMVSPLLLETAATWILDGTAVQTVVRKRAEITHRQSQARNILAGHAYSSHPQSYYLWLDLPGGWTGSEFETEARRRGVGVTSSRPFSARAHQGPEGARVCLSAAESRSELEAALRTLAHLLDEPGSRTPGLL